MRAAYVVSGDTALCADREAQTVASLFAVLDGTMLGLVSSHDDSALLYCIPSVIVDGVVYPYSLPSCTNCSTMSPMVWNSGHMTGVAGGMAEVTHLWLQGSFPFTHRWCDLCSHCTLRVCSIRFLPY